MNEVGWCIRCMTWVYSEFGMCSVCGATTLANPPPVIDPPVSIVIGDPDEEMQRHEGEQ